jgi:hypothetical protein
MKNSDLPTRWKERVESWVQTHTGGKRTQLGASDFPAGKVVHIDLPDGSSARFRYAVVIEAPDLGEVGIFTEHCGYHVFPYHETKVRIQDGI